MTDPAAPPREPPDPGTVTTGTSASDANITQSVQAATLALNQLEQSLRAAGFLEGTSAYERMADVLLAQWVSQGVAGRHTVDFQRLGEIAGRIFGILHPYSVVMRRLAALAPDDGERVRATVIAELQRRGRRGASPSVLSRMTGIKPSTVDAALARLVADGAVQLRGTGSAPSFVVAEADGRGRRPPPRSASARAEQARTTRTQRGGR
jgi:hypothetical protein